jgi:hypothetical protein
MSTAQGCNARGRQPAASTRVPSYGGYDQLSSLIRLKLTQAATEAATAPAIPAPIKNSMVCPYRIHMPNR